MKGIRKRTYDGNLVLVLVEMSPESALELLTTPKYRNEVLAMQFSTKETAEKTKKFSKNLPITFQPLL